MSALPILMVLSLGQLEPAMSAYDKGDFASCVRAVESVERARGPSPQSASLRALALNELGQSLEAYKALKVYFRLVEGRSMRGSPAHEALEQLFKELETQLRREKEQKERELVDEGADDAKGSKKTEARLAAAELEKKEAAFAQREKELQRKSAIEDAIEARRAHDAK